MISLYLCQMAFLPAYLIWDPDPAIIPGLPFRWYGMLFALSFFAGYLIVRYCFTTEKIPFYHMEKMAIPMVLGTIGGARIGHILFYDPVFYWEHPLEVFKVWKGGLASHGAAIFITLAVILYARRAKWPFLWIADRIAITIALSGLFIRGGNFVNSEILGKETTLPWGVVFVQADQHPPYEMAVWNGDDVDLTFRADPRRARAFDIFLRQPDSSFQLVGTLPASAGSPEGQYEFTMPSPGLGHLAYFVREEAQLSEKVLMDSATGTQVTLLAPLTRDGSLQLGGEWQQGSFSLKGSVSPNWAQTKAAVWFSKDKVNWQVLGTQDVGAKGAQFQLVQNLKPGEKAWFRLINSTEHVSEINLFARHPSMLYESVIYFGIFLFLFWLYRRHKGHPPHGLLTGWFFFLIFTVRILVEFTKIEQTDFQHSMPLNMGQVLSIPFVILGIVFLIRSRGARTDSPVEEVPDEANAKKP